MCKSIFSTLLLMRRIDRRIKVVNVTVIVCMGLVSCHPQPVGVRDTESVELQWTKLDEFAQEALNSEGTKRQESLVQFFELFPDDFGTFHKIYGNQEEPILYPTRSYSYMLHFFLPELRKAIPTEEYYKKMIGVGVGGLWEADEIGALAHHLWKLIPENVPLSIKVLGEYEEKEIRSFWYFLYDGPHPGHRLKREHFEELYPRVRDIDPDIAKQLKQAYAQLLSKHDGNGH